MELDLLDRKILFQLDLDARQSLAQLSRTLRVPRDRVEYRYNRLCSEGIIKQSTVTLNPYHLGLTIYKTYLKVTKGSAAYEEFRKFLSHHPRVYWVAECDGSWDLIYALFARSPYEFHTLQNEILTKFREVVLGFNVYTLVNVWMYGKHYLVGGGTKSFLVGGPPSNYSPDKIEWKILEALSRDARQSIPELAGKLKTTEMVVRHRIKKMESAGLIAGYRIELDFPRINMTMFKAQLFLNTCSKAQESKFKAYCAAHPHITYYIEQVGECELELELEVDGYVQFTAIVNELRQKFSEVIRNVETVILHRSWFNWVPYEVVKAE